MNISTYLESRFVGSQIALNDSAQNQCQTPSGVAENQALKVLMWTHLSLWTVFHLFAVIFRWGAIQCRLAQPPKEAREIASDYYEGQARAQAARAKLAATVQADLQKESFPPKTTDEAEIKAMH